MCRESLHETDNGLLLHLTDFFTARSSLSSTLTSLEIAHRDLANSQVELRQAKNHLSQTTQDLIESGKKIDSLNENRWVSFYLFLFHLELYSFTIRQKYQILHIL